VRLVVKIIQIINEMLRTEKQSGLNLESKNCRC